MTPPPEDQAARDRIRSDLQTNLLVEAGAGAGKTHELVERMIALVRSGIAVEQIAAITFTRKAAAELAARFRDGVEAALRRDGGDATEAKRLRRALPDIDRAFTGTIHAFCARLLRQHPLEAGVDPGFEELSEAGKKAALVDFWTRAMDRLQAVGDPRLDALASAGVSQRQLRDVFERVLDDSDVTFPVDDVVLPDLPPLRRRLEDLLDDALELLPGERPVKGWDTLQEKVRELARLHRTSDWSTPEALFTALAELPQRDVQVTFNRWTLDPEIKERVRGLKTAIEAFGSGPAAEALDAWYARRYAVVMDLLDPLRREFARERLRTGRLTFQDLLQLAADLLDRHTDIRREAGTRITHLLVDEFQDTDPLQAEVCLLLTSAPDQGDDWRAVRPRPGSLFVVGDPKQSIYRFRRADLSVYDFVRRRFLEFGDVVVLTENFRSRQAIAGFVNTAFSQLLPTDASDVQAAFSEMRVQRRPGGAVMRYIVSRKLAGGGRAGLQARDAELVASWIARRLRDDPDLRPSDFLVLPHLRDLLATYGRALEERAIPVTVTGAGLTVERELRELLIVLAALADPDDEVTAVAALQGLFFGIDPAQLWRHRRGGGRFTFRRPPTARSTAVEQALATLARWWKWVRRVPADVVVERIVHEVGLLPLAAAGEMGDSRAGSLIHALETVAVEAVRGASDLRSAIAAIQSAAASPDVEAQLRPGSGDAVRVMNLHKAKGLESRIVILPHPAGQPNHPPDRHVERIEGGAVRGWLHLRRRVGWGWKTVARPLGWAAMEAEEAVRDEAEVRRLLYVASTRPRDELVVADSPDPGDRSPWQLLSPELRRSARTITPEAETPPGKPLADVPFDEIAAAVASVELLRTQAGEPSFTVTSVTRRADEDLEFRGAGMGAEWGTIVHRAIVAMGRGRTADRLRDYARALLLEAGRPLDAEGEPTELPRLLTLLNHVQNSPIWPELAANGRWELTLQWLERPEGALPVLLSGAVDALALGPDGRPTRLVDWKTDAVEGPEWEARERHYRDQVEAYSRMVEALTGTRPAPELVRVR